jgi:hypothetical protein
MSVVTDLPPKGGGKIGGMKKEYVYGGLAIGGIVIAVVYFRSKSQSNATNTTGTVTDPAGNVCAALSPSSGYCPGTPEDLAYAGNTASGSGGLVGTDSSSYVGGQIIGYDQYGNPIYSSNSGQGNTGPGTFTNNSNWVQACVTYITDADGNANASTILNALGLYINGQDIGSDANRSIIEQAIAAEGFPPVAGASGNPPGIVQKSGTGNGGGGSSNEPAVNPVKGLHAQSVAYDNFDVAWQPSKNAAGYTVTVTKAGKQVTQQQTNATNIHIAHMAKKTRYTVRVWATPHPAKGTPASITVTTK